VLLGVRERDEHGGRDGFEEVRNEWRVNVIKLLQLVQVDFVGALASEEGVDRGISRRRRVEKLALGLGGDVADALGLEGGDGGEVRCKDLLAFIGCVRGRDGVDVAGVEVGGREELEDVQQDCGPRRGGLCVGLDVGGDVGHEACSKLKRVGLAL